MSLTVVCKHASSEWDEESCEWRGKVVGICHDGVLASLRHVFSDDTRCDVTGWAATEFSKFK
jgi:hypothetical protein